MVEIIRSRAAAIVAVAVLGCAAGFAAAQIVVVTMFLTDAADESPLVLFAAPLGLCAVVFAMRAVVRWIEGWRTSRTQNRSARSTV